MKKIVFLVLYISTFTPFLVSIFAQNVGINTASPLGKLHIKGSENISQLLIDANSTQGNTSPLIRLRKGTDIDLLWIHSDDSTNTFMGLKAGRVNVIGPHGVNNTFIGSHAGYSNTNGRDNTVVGTNALHSNTKAGWNVAIGTNALFSQSFSPGAVWYPSRNVAVGYEALYANQPTNTASGVNNTAIGSLALRNNTSGTQNTASGTYSLNSNISGNNNSALGVYALYLNTNAGENTAFGYRALYNQSYDPGASWVSGNVAIGVEALYFNQPTSVTEGMQNTALGNHALRTNTIGSRNTAIGYDADVVTNDLTNATAIGYNAKVGVSDAMVLGGTGPDAVKVGIGVNNPLAVLDINGDIVIRTDDLLVEDAVTLGLDVNTEKFSSYRISGADSSFALAGIAAGVDGRLITLINGSGFPMTLHHEDTNAAETDRIFTGNQADLILGDMGLVTLQYDTSAQRWLVNSSNQVAGESVWDTSGANIYFDNYVGIGTQEPMAPLTIETVLNEPGLSHMAMSGADSIILESTITGIGASIGTSSNDIFSLNAGGIGKVHIWPDGNVVIGDDVDPNDFAGNGTSSRMTPLESRLTLETPINSAGWIHIGGQDSIIVSEGIGGISASLGTFTNHAFRLNTNGQGRLHLLADGNVIVGTNSQGPYGKFTVHTPNNSDGISHISNGGILLKTIVGGVSAGFGTFSNHMMRIFSNSIAVINIDPAGNIGIGTLDPLPGYKLSVNGNVKAKELVIETAGWPDYVFGESYAPLSLRELEEFIRLNHHLPNIPPAAELESNGVGVGDMQVRMMEKIEELTLYIIDQNKRIEELEKKINDQ